MLHESLEDLSEVAQHCDHLATVRGVIAESQDLMRNAVDHAAKPQELVAWYSRLLSDALHSEGVLDATGGVRLVLSGAVGRGDALPSSTITWLALSPAQAEEDVTDATDVVAGMLRDLGLTVAQASLRSAPASRQQWLQRIEAATGQTLAFYADAGTWSLRRVNELSPTDELLRQALALQPPLVHSQQGMPSTASVVSVRDQLLAPIVGLARWAGVAAECPSAATPDRLRYAQHAHLLSETEVTSLLQAFDAAQDLELQRWRQRVQAAHTTPTSLTAIQRSVFGASARLVADVMRAVQARHRINDVSGSGASVE